jgi:hypothetical protein
VRAGYDVLIDLYGAMSPYTYPKGIAIASRQVIQPRVLWQAGFKIASLVDNS